MKPSYWDFRLDPNECRNYVLSETIDLCDEKRVIDIEMDGNLDKAFPRYCRCYLYKEMNIELKTLEEPPKQTAAPTASVTIAPTEAPTACNVMNVVITELASPFNAPYARYIELFFGRKCGGFIINRDLMIVRWLPGNNQPATERISLKGIEIPLSGFMVICNVQDANNYYGSNTCDMIGSLSSPANVEGTDTIAVIDEQGEFDLRIVDIFGVPGRTDVGSSDQDFTDGRAVRKVAFPNPDNFWASNHWVILRGADDGKISDMDPGIWVFTPTSIPNPPTASPTYIVTVPGFTCEYFLTELANPVDDEELDFIEIKATCPGEIIDNIVVVAWKDTVRVAFLTQIDLNRVPDDGFIIICKNETAFENFYGEKCDIEQADIQPEGVYSIALKMFDDTTLDIYGTPEEPLNATEVFTDGRAVRDFAADEPSPTFNPHIWHITPGDGDDVVHAIDMDPRAWSDDPLIIFFTELADPSDNPDNRFIELYSPNKKNYVIKENLIVIKYDSNDNILGYESLLGKKTDADGFMVMCVMPWSSKCTVTLGYSGFVDEPGTASYALTSCTSLANLECTRIDVYGLQADSADHDYSNGRAYRRKSAELIPSINFELGDWIILPGRNGGTVPSYGCDPGYWGEETQPPVTSPTTISDGGSQQPASGKGGKGGKGSPPPPKDPVGPPSEVDQAVYSPTGPNTSRPPTGKGTLPPPPPLGKGIAIGPTGDEPLHLGPKIRNRKRGLRN